MPIARIDPVRVLLRRPALAVLSLWLMAGMVAAQPAQQELPDGIRPFSPEILLTMTAEEHWYHANATLDLDMDRTLDEPPIGYMAPSTLCISLLDLAYPYLNPMNDSREKAINLAQRLSIGDCDMRDILLADLVYAPDGRHPDAEMYRHRVRKTAAYVAYFESHFYFQLSEDRPPAAFVFPGVSRIGQERLLALKKEAKSIARSVRHEIESQPACARLSNAVAYWHGDTLIGRDRGYAEILIRSLNRELEPHPADVEYLLGTLGPQLPIAPETPETSEALLGLAAELGHPFAAFWEAKRLLAAGDTRRAQYFLTIGQLQSVAEAQNHLALSIREIGDLRNIRVQERAQAISVSYKQTGCGLKLDTRG